MRENDFNRIEYIADRHEETLRRLHAGFDPEPVILDDTTLDGRLPPNNSL